MNYFPTFTLLTALPIVLVMTYPAKTPYVTRRGSDVHENIWLWRIPAYLDHPAWRVRWSIRDGLKARAYCYDPEDSAQYRAVHVRS